MHYFFIGIWCKGSTTDFDSVGSSSNLLIPAKLRKGVRYWKQSRSSLKAKNNSLNYGVNFATA